MALNKNDLVQVFELYLSRWRLISLGLFISLITAFIYIRYATTQYKAEATIKIQGEQQSQKLQTSVLRDNNSNYQEASKNISDEAKIILSRNLLESVVKNLKLNIRYFTLGKIKEKEDYINPPVKINFFASDSILNKIDTTFLISVKSKSEFYIIEEDDINKIDNSNTGDFNTVSFGDRISTGFGDVVIVPNLSEFSSKIGNNLKITISPVETVTNKYKAKISVSNAKESSLLKLELKDNIPDRAIDVLNELILEYNKDVLNEKEEVVKITSEFINNRLQVVSADLEQVDFTAEQLQKKNRLTALNSQTDLFLQTEKQTESEILNTTNKIQMISFLKNEVENNSISDPLPANIGIENTNLSTSLNSHNDLVAQRNRILRNSSELNPVVIKLNNQINSIKSSLKATLDNMYQTSQFTLSSLQKEDRRIRGQLYSAPTKERQFRDIKRQQDIKESLYLFLLQQREETAIRLGMYSPKAKIIETAHSSYVPVSPNIKIIYIASIIFGLAIPIGFIYIQELFNTKIHTKDDLIKLTDAPIIGDIPKYGTLKGKSVVSAVDYSPKAEAFRLLRTNIDFIMRGKWKEGKTIFITSTIAQEGKSHTSVNLATTISHSNKKVLMIETDIRVPSSSKYLQIKNKNKGLTEFIVDESLKVKDIIYSVEGKRGFDIIPSGTVPPNPAELLMSERVPKLLAEVKKQYDYIIVDTAAVGLVTDTLLFAEFADIFIYVVSANNIDKRQLHVAQTMYNEKRLPNMHLLLNGTKKIAGYGYGYGYGKDPESNSKKWYDKIPFIKVKA